MDVIGTAPPTIIPIPKDSKESTTDIKVPTVIIPDNEQDRVNLRKEILSQTKEKIACYTRLQSRWSLLYFLLGISSLISNITVVVISSLSSSVEFNREVVLAFLGAVSTVALSLNESLKCNMNAAYFNEAVAKYNEVELLVWNDLAAAEETLMLLNQTYDSRGVGTWFKFGDSSSVTSTSEIKKKRYAYK